MLKYLRIAVTALSLTACVLLIALWVRSYRWSDRLDGPLPRAYVFQASTRRGGLDVFVSGPAFRLKRWETFSHRQAADSWQTTRRYPSYFGFGFANIQGRLH